MVILTDRYAVRKGFVLSLCKCDCGAVWITRRCGVLAGHVRSCGCLQRKAARQQGLRNTKHGFARRIGGQSREYKIWAGIVQRCYNPHREDYPEYGGRGIRMCRRWRTSFMAFYRDMGNRPSPQHSIDRIENDKGYAPSNCRWATSTTQNRNRRNTKWTR